MPKKIIAYSAGGDFTASQDDFEFDLISLNATTALTLTLPEAYEGAMAWLTNSGDADSVTINKPDASTLLVLQNLASVLLYCYLNSSGVPQWAYGLPQDTASGAPKTYTITNVTTDRAYDADATTDAEIADVLGTLIADLQATGIIT